jgi:hypothetical protein
MQNCHGGMVPGELCEADWRYFGGTANIDNCGLYDVYEMVCPELTDEEYCNSLFTGHRRVCGVDDTGNCIMNVYTAHNGEPDTCKRWCEAQGRQCIHAADNYGWPDHTCVVDTVTADWNVGRDPCEQIFWDQLCTCG